MKRFLLIVFTLLIILAVVIALIGSLELYGISFIPGLTLVVWEKISVALLVLLALITISSILIGRYIFTLPIRRITQWFISFQKGQTQELQPFKEGGELGKLVSEVEQVALSLRVAQRATMEESRE